MMAFAFEIAKLRDVQLLIDPIDREICPKPPVHQIPTAVRTRHDTRVTKMQTEIQRDPFDQKRVGTFLEQGKPVVPVAFDSPSAQEISSWIDG